MLSSKTRILWIKWHAYLSCFFLPLALLYALTGLLYLFDVKGGAAQELEYEIATSLTLPLNETQAQKLVKDFLMAAPSTSEHLPLPVNYYRSGDVQGWWDFEQEIMLMRASETDGHAVRLVIEKNNLWRQFVFIHKGLAGDVFHVLGIFLALSILFSLLSGTLVALVMPKLKKNATLFMGLGFVVVLLAYGVS